MPDLRGRIKKLKGLEFTRWATQPALIFTLIFFVAPLAIMVVVSFWQRVSGKLVASWSGANYSKFFGTDYLLESLTNSIEVTLVTTVISILLAYPLAYILAYRIPPKWQKIILKKFLNLENIYSIIMV